MSDSEHNYIPALECVKLLRSVKYPDKSICRYYILECLKSGRTEGTGLKTVMGFEEGGAEDKTQHVREKALTAKKHASLLPTADLNAQRVWTPTGYYYLIDSETTGRREKIPSQVWYLHSTWEEEFLIKSSNLTVYPVDSDPDEGGQDVADDQDALEYWRALGYPEAAFITFDDILIDWTALESTARLERRTQDQLHATMQGFRYATPRGRPKDPVWNDWWAALMILAYDRRIEPGMRKSDLLRKVDALLVSWGSATIDRKTVETTLTNLLDKFDRHPRR
jgi:hypothetical protein